MSPFGRRRKRSRKGLRRRGCKRRVSSLISGETLSLLDVEVGEESRVVGFSGELNKARKARLQAYGITPGHWVYIIQHSPVTVVRIEHLEIALEHDLARKIRVDNIRLKTKDV